MISKSKFNVFMQLKQDISKEAISNIEVTITNIFTSFFSEKIDNILLIGKVQSGKTNTFLSFLTLVLESKVDCVIILTGTKISLNEQTFNRTKEELGSIFPNILITKEITAKELRLLDRDDDEKMIFVLKKQSKDLKKIKTELYNAKNKTFLIIDDEVDHASQDNNVKRGHHIQKKESSATNKSLVELLKQLRLRNETKYLGVTATPFISLYIKEWEYLKFQKIMFINHTVDYMGLNVFHNTQGKYIQFLNEEFSDAFSRKEIMQTDIQSWWQRNIVIILMELEKIIVLHLFKTAKLYYKDEKLRKRSKMMIHLTERKKIQKMITKLVLDILEKTFKNKNKFIEKIKKLKKWDDDEVEKIGSKFFDKISTQLKKEKNINNSGIFANHIKVTLLNSEANKDMKAQDKKCKYFEIVIGGENLSRGLTLNNLITSIFLRDPKNHQFDSTLQRARWFGYRKKTLDLIDIFTSYRISYVFETFRETEEDLWTYRDKTILFKDLDKISIKIDKLIKTDRRHHGLIINNFNDDKIITFTHKINNNLAKELEEKFAYPGWNVKKAKEFLHSQNHSATFKKITEILPKLEEIRKEINQSISQLDNLIEIMKRHVNSKIRVLWILKNDAKYKGQKIFLRELSFDSQGKLTSLFRGASNNINATNKYIGDKNLVNELIEYDKNKEFIGDLLFFNVKNKDEKNAKNQYYFSFVPIIERINKNKKSELVKVIRAKSY